jgi:hypothetical protein
MSNKNSAKVNGLCNGVDEIHISSTDEVGSHPPSSVLSASDNRRGSGLPKYFTADFLSKQPWIRTADSVRHRLRGILITQDTFPIFRLSFEDDNAARCFLGELLVAMSASRRFMRVSEIQLEEMNATWDETMRPVSPQFCPTELDVTVAYRTTYQISTQNEIIKTLHYVALSTNYIGELIENAICNRELNGLWNGSATAMAKQMPFSRHSQQRESVENNLELATSYSAKAETPCPGKTLYLFR